MAGGPVTVTQNASVLHPLYGAKYFTIGQVIQPADPFYFFLISAGYTDSDIQIVRKLTYYQGNPTNGQSLKWDVDKGIFVPYTPGTGVGGKGIANVEISNGHLLVHFTDLTTTDVGQVVGAQGNPGVGAPGAPGTNGRGISGATITAGKLVLTFTDGSASNLGTVVGSNGSNGIGITNAAITLKKLILTYSDGSTADLGTVVGADGSNGNNGIGISGAAITNKRLIISFTDGSSTDVGVVVGADGTNATFDPMFEFTNTDLSLPANGATPPIGQRIALFKNRSATDGDYALGVSANNLWFSVGSATTRTISFYVANSLKIQIGNNGLAVTGNTSTTGFLTVGTGSKLGALLSGRTTSYTSNGGDYKYFEYITAGVTHTLPTVSSTVAYDQYIINASNGNITVSGGLPSATIGNTSSATQTFTLAPGATLQVISNGTVWRVL